MPKAKQKSTRKATPRRTRGSQGVPSSPAIASEDVGVVSAASQDPVINGESNNVGAIWPTLTPSDFGRIGTQEHDFPAPRPPPSPPPPQAPPQAPPSPSSHNTPGVTSADHYQQPSMLSCVCDELGGEVPGSIKDKIWRGEYIDLGLLLKKDVVQDPIQTFSLCSSGSSVMLRPQSKAQTIYSIEQWTSAFLVYASIYLERHPTRARELLKYMDIVRSIVRYGGHNWRSYDSQFRLRQARHPHRSWAIIDTELWLTIATPSPAASPFAPNFPFPSGRSQPFRTFDRGSRRGDLPSPRQYGPFRSPGPRTQLPCFAFNDTGACARTNCRYTHRCSICGATTHGSSSCSKQTKAANKKQRPRLPNTN